MKEEISIILFPPKNMKASCINDFEFCTLIRIECGQIGSSRSHIGSKMHLQMNNGPSVWANLFARPPAIVWFYSIKSHFLLNQCKAKDMQTTNENAATWTIIAIWRAPCLIVCRHFSHLAFSAAYETLYGNASFIFSFNKTEYNTKNCHKTVNKLT